MTSNISAEALVDLEIPDQVQISPDGKQIAYMLQPLGKKDDNNVSSIWLADVGKEHSARQLTSGSFHDSSPKWSPDGKYIAFISDRENPGESNAIYLLPMHGGEAFAMTRKESKKFISQLGWSPDGAFIAYISPDETTDKDEAKKKSKDDVKVWGTEWEHNRLRLVHVSTRETTVVYDEAAHVSQFAWRDDSQSIAYVLHQTPELDSTAYSGVTFERYSVAQKTSTVLSHFPTKVRGSVIYRDKYIRFIGGYEPDQMCTSQSIYNLDLEDGQWTRLDHGVNDDAAALVVSNGHIFVETQSGLSEHFSLHDPDRREVYSAPQDVSTWDVLKPKAAERFVLALGTSTIGSPKEMYSIEGALASDFDNLAVVQLSNHGHRLRTDLGTWHPLDCKTFDGETSLNGVIILPQGSTNTNSNGQNKPAKPLPTVVAIHGGPQMRYTATFEVDYFYWSPLLLAHGYAIVVPNYRGGSARGHAFTAHSHGEMGTVDYEDVIATVRTGIKQGYIDKDRIVVSGWSQGGFLSYLSAVRNDPARGWNFKGAICGAGVTDWDMLVMTSDVPAFEADLAGAAPWTAGRTKDDTRTRSGSAIWEMRGTHVPPILILHGEDDPRVPLTQAWAFQRACRHYKVPCEMAVYPREGHIIGERAHLIDMAKRVLRFCDTHIRG